MNNDNQVTNSGNVSNANNNTIPQPQSYHVNPNLNAMSSFDEVNVNSTLQSNIQSNNMQNVVMPGYNTPVNNNVNPNSGGLVPEVNNQNVQQPSNSTQVLYDTTNNINDKPVVKKKKKNQLNINPELRFAIVLLIILLIFITIMPTLFDWFDNLKLQIFG